MAIVTVTSGWPCGPGRRDGLPGPRLGQGSVQGGRAARWPCWRGACSCTCTPGPGCTSRWLGGPGRCTAVSVPGKYSCCCGRGWRGLSAARSPLVAAPRPPASPAPGTFGASSVPDPPRWQAVPLPVRPSRRAENRIRFIVVPNPTGCLRRSHRKGFSPFPMEFSLYDVTCHCVPPRTQVLGPRAQGSVPPGAGAGRAPRWPAVWVQARPAPQRETTWDPAAPHGGASCSALFPSFSYRCCFGTRIRISQPVSREPDGDSHPVRIWFSTQFRKTRQ